MDYFNIIEYFDQGNTPSKLFYNFNTLKIILSVLYTLKNLVFLL